jgi:hypothetical protein
MRWAEHVEYLMNMTNEYIILVGKPEGKKLLGRIIRGWENIYKKRINQM